MTSPDMMEHDSLLNCAIQTADIQVCLQDGWVMGLKYSYRACVTPKDALVVTVGNGSVALKIAIFAPYRIVVFLGGEQFRLIVTITVSGVGVCVRAQLRSDTF